MKSHRNIKTIAGLILSAMLAAVSQAEVTLSDFSSFALNGTYVQWNTGTFTSGATAFTVQANDFGGGYKNLAPAVNASGNDTISIKLDVNAGNVADKFNIVLVDGDGTERAYRFDGLTIGNNQTLTKNVASFLGDNQPGSQPGLNLANLTAFHIQGTFANGDPGQAMNLTFDNISFVVAPFVPDVILNGDFEIPAGSGWGTVQGTPSYPATGGNPNGHTVLDGTAGFAVLYAFNNSEKTFASLGLAPGDTYTFQMDMKLVEGANIGGLRLEGPAGYVVESYPTIIGDGTNWATYSIELTVPNSPGQSKFGLRPGGGSKVAFDNVKIVLPGPPAPLQAGITLGNSVSWTAASAVNQYQLQESEDAGGPWTNAGPALIGNSVTSVFDVTKSPFYQVLQSVPSIQETVYNGGFEENFPGFPEDAEGWEELGFTGPAPDIDQAPMRILTGAHTGDACMQVKVQNAATLAESGKSLIQLNTFNADAVIGEIIPGNTYTFSFWAKQISSGVSYVQQYKVAFLNGASAIVGTTGDVNFAAGPAWTQITVNGLVAPAGAETALIEIIGLTGAVDNGSGEVHIDDVSLLSSGFGAATVLVPAPTVTPAAEVSWLSKTGKSYQVQSSPDLATWTNFGAVIPGNGSIKAVYDTMIDKEFFRVGELP